MARDPGNTLQSAKFVAIRADAQTFSDKLGGRDVVDLWRFDNRARSRLNLSLNGLSRKANADVLVLNNSGKVLAASRKLGNATEQLSNIQLEKGTYYIEVQQQGRKRTRYNLTLAAVPTDVPSPAPAPTPSPRVPIAVPVPAPAIAPRPAPAPISTPAPPAPAADASGNTFETAARLEKVSDTRNDFIGGSDPSDFYAFGAPVAGQFNVELSGLTSDAKIELFDSKRSLIVASDNPGTANETINRALTDIAGSTYYLKVSSNASKETKYSLKYEYAPAQITQSSSGVGYIKLKDGTGEVPRPGDEVTVQYTGTLTNGSKFDSSRDRNQPFTFKLGDSNLIRGFNQGISEMKVGERRQLLIPAELGYGAQGSGDRIPPNSPLIFDVEVISIKRQQGLDLPVGIGLAL
jgi:FKBP-type peptidyl-prolyl cis-trans isomerase